QRLAARGPAALRTTVVLPAAASPLAAPIRGEAEERLPATTPAGRPAEEAKWAPSGPNASEARVRLTRDAWALVTEGVAPGWHAYVVGGDGGEGEVPPLRGDFAFRAVPLPAGEHRVRFRYEPFTFRVGLFLAGLGLMALAAWLGATIGVRSGSIR